MSARPPGADDPAFGPREQVESDLVRAARTLADRQPLIVDADYFALRRYLVRLAARRSSLGLTEAEDVADEALARFLSAAARGSIDRETALPYLIRIVQNEIIDRSRKRRNMVTEPFEDQPMTDDAIARLVDSAATAAMLEAALERAARGEDFTCTSVINEWLREAEQQGASPSSREVARRAGVSHVTVQKALRRFRRYLQEVAGGSGGTGDPPTEP